MASGKRTFGGLVDDGVKSGVRYVLNNFFDGHKQDALDLLTGTYTIKKGVLLRRTLLQSLLCEKVKLMCLCPMGSRQGHARDAVSITEH